VKTIHRADRDAVREATPLAVFGYDESHELNPLLNWTRAFF
jgi:hypothetical protein